MNSHETLHERACAAARNYLRAEYELIEAIDEVDRARLFVQLGFSSMFAYCVEGLKLSESVTFNCINVARKSRTVPALKEQIRTGALSVSKARKIIPVLTPENQSIWLAKATTLGQRQLEKEVARENPRAAVVERATYVSGQRLQLQLGLEERVMLEFRRAQDLVSQNTGRAASLEETLARVLEFYLVAKDPVRRAKRVVAKKGCGGGGRKAAPKTETVVRQADATKDVASSAAEKQPVARQPSTLFTRTPIPAAVLHHIRLRDEGRCTHMDDWPCKAKVIFRSSSFDFNELLEDQSNSYSRTG